MPGFLLSLLLAQTAMAVAPAKTTERLQPQTYKSAKSLASIEQCLVQELSDLGDPTFMRTVDSTTLVIRNGEAAPLLIEITPPKVTITTRASYETRVRVRRCV
jgi:hypothetical protein